MQDIFYELHNNSQLALYTSWMISVTMKCDICPKVGMSVLARNMPAEDSEQSARRKLKFIKKGYVVKKHPLCFAVLKQIPNVTNR